MQAASRAMKSTQVMPLVSIDAAASIIGVSTATIRNWVKAGHLVAAGARPVGFLEEDVNKLKADIGSGEVLRLRKRANKSRSNAMSIPKEYVSHQGLIGTVQCIVDTFTTGNLDLETTMFFIALRVLVLRGEVRHTPSASIYETSSFTSWRHSSLKREMAFWRSSLPKIEIDAAYGLVYSAFSTVEEDDFIGLVYQCLNKEGDKSNRGSYYTPLSIVDEAIANQTFTGATFLDPCCGTGNYLMRAAKLLNLSPQNLFGYDNDALAVRIARINFCLAFPSHNGAPNIECLNTLTELATGELLCDTNNLLGKIDLVATNPPWGAYKNASQMAHKYCEIGSTEVFALFIAKSLTLLREGGSLSFILPESFLTIKTHRDIRKVILTQTKVQRIVDLGRQFTGVFTPVIRLDLTKEKAGVDWKVAIEGSGDSSFIEQSRFLQNDDYVFDVAVNTNEDALIKKLYQTSHATLLGNAEWALGIVTGNNSKYVHAHQGVGMEGIVRGSDISQYRLRKAESFIHFDRDAFQQVAKDDFYRASEKLIYKFISSTLVFAYDDKQVLTLNSANILIPRLPQYSIKVALAFLNSCVFQYLFKKKFSTHKVLRGNLERLPFPILSKNTHRVIEGLVDATLAGIDQTDCIDEVICTCFGLSQEEVALIKQGE